MKRTRSWTLRNRRKNTQKEKEEREEEEEEKKKEEEQEQYEKEKTEKEAEKEAEKEEETEVETEASLEERELKRPKNDTLTEISKVKSLLENRIVQHRNNVIATQSEIEETCRALREAVNSLEESLNSTLQKGYTEEEARLQEALQKLRRLESGEATSDEETGKELNEAKYSLCGSQCYELIKPQYDDLKEWASGILGAGLRVNTKQLLSEEILRDRVPIITEMSEVNPNEVNIEVSFLEPEEEAAMKKMKLWSGIEYMVEMWNGERGEDYEVRTEQVLGPSHNAYVEWRFKRGCECKIRVRAIRRDIRGEEYLSEWSEWISFLIPKRHKNSGAVGVGVVWDMRSAGETYTLLSKKDFEVFYNGVKPYTLIPKEGRGHRLMIWGRKGERKWEEIRLIDEIAPTPENLIDDLRIFHTNGEICKQALKDIVFLSKSKKKKKRFII